VLERGHRSDPAFARGGFGRGGWQWWWVDLELWVFEGLEFGGGFVCGRERGGSGEPFEMPPPTRRSNGSFVISNFESCRFSAAVVWAGFLSYVQWF
jgi:hypothetical protein